MHPKLKRTLRWWPYAVIPLLVYFGNVELQSHLGRQALNQLDYPALTLREAQDQARREGKRVLADLSAIWCPSCRKLDTEVLAKQAVKQAILADYVFVRIEYESPEGEAFMQRYGVRGFPSLLILDADGSVVKPLTLTFSPDAFISQL